MERARAALSAIKADPSSAQTVLEEAAVDRQGHEGFLVDLGAWVAQALDGVVVDPKDI